MTSRAGVASRRRRVDNPGGEVPVPRRMKGAKGKKRAARPRAALARIPLPKKTEARHADRKKYERAREKERLRREEP